MGLVSFFLPFFPLERRHLRQLFEMRLDERGRELAGAGLGGLRWDPAVVDFLLDRARGSAGTGCARSAQPLACDRRCTCKRMRPCSPSDQPMQVDFEGDFPIEGAKEVTTLLTRYASRPLRLWAAAQQAAADAALGKGSKGSGSGSSGGGGGGTGGGGGAAGAGRLRVAPGGRELAIEPAAALA